MKYILIKMIDLYKILPISTHKMCRHTPTCSSYAKEAIMEHGSVKGSYLAFKRILKCNPFGTYGYDPIPKKKEIKL